MWVALSLAIVGLIVAPSIGAGLTGSGPLVGAPGFVHAVRRPAGRLPSPSATSTLTPVGNAPVDVVVNSTSGEVYVANALSHNVTVVAAATGRAIATVPVGVYPSWLALDPSSGRLFVANMVSHNVSVIDTGTNRVVGSISVGSTVGQVVYDPANGMVYLAATASNQVDVINGATDAIVTSFVIPQPSLGFFPQWLAVGPVDGLLYMTSGLAPQVLAVNLTTTAVVASMRVAPFAGALAYDAGDGNVYVAQQLSDTHDVANVSVFNAATQALRATIPVGAAPNAFAIDPTHRTVYVTNGNSNSITLIRGGSEAVVGTIGVGSDPSGIAVDAAIGQLFVTFTANNAPLLGQGVLLSLSTGAPYTVTFSEAGLAPPTAWTVVVEGIAQSSIARDVRYSLPNGTYSFSIGAPAGYTATNATSGLVTVQGATTGPGSTFVENATPPPSGGSGLPLLTIALLVGGAVVVVGAAAVFLRARHKRR